VIDGRIPKQSSLLSLPRKMAGDVEPDELDWDKTVSGSWLCIIPCTIYIYIYIYCFYHTLGFSGMGGKNKEFMSFIN